MISELRIRDLGVIREATVQLHRGLTAVTGETGAGKTMIVTGMGLLAGQRADPRSVRRGADRARVEGRFLVDDPALAATIAAAGGEIEDGELIVARQVTEAGRSRAFLGGASVPVSLIAEALAELVTLHGQSDQLRLTDPDRQRALLDAYAGTELRGWLDPYVADHGERRTAVVERDRLRADEQQRVREADLLTFGLEEIERLDPQPGEDVALGAEANRLHSADDLRAVAAAAMDALAGSDDEAGGALAEASAARRALRSAPGADAELAGLDARIGEATALLADVTADLARYLDDLAAEPGRLEQIAARRSALAGLTRKYGATVDEVLAWGARAAGRLAALAGSDQRIAELDERVAALDGQLAAAAVQITRLRVAAASRIAAAVRPELAALALPHAELVFAVTPAAGLGPAGGDLVDLVFRANPGGELRPLGRVASGGELSRVRLALEVVLAGETAPQTLVFDEVDAGVGGRVAVEIGRRLAALARRHQIVVVTHLAQVAAFADRHYVVVKADDGEVTTSGVVEVSTAERTAELARMMAGLDTSDSALAHAGELVELAATARRGD